MTPFGVDFPRRVPPVVSRLRLTGPCVLCTHIHTYSWAEVGSPLEVPASFLPPARKDSLHIDDDLLLDGGEDLLVELRIVLVPARVLTQAPELLDGARARVLGGDLPRHSKSRGAEDLVLHVLRKKRAG